MQAHPKENNVQLSACETLVKFTTKLTDKVLSDMDMSGDIGDVADAMEFHIDDVNIQKSGINILLNLSKDQKSMEALVTADCAEIIAEVMRYHPEDKTVCQESVSLLARMATGSTNAIHALQSITDTVYLTINAMLASPCDKKILSNGVVVLHALSHETEAKDSIFNLGGVGAVLQAMRSNQSNENVQSQCVKVLYRIFLDDQRAQSLNSDSARAIISTTVSAMESAISLSSLQADAATLLWTLCSRDKTLVKLALDCGALYVLLRAAKVHIDSASVQERFLDALHYLAVDEV